VQEELFSDSSPVPVRKPRSKREKADSVPPDDVATVWNEWIVVHREGTRKPAFTEDRRILVACAIHDFGVHACIEAIHGCKMSPFHQGDNDRGRKYDDVGLILRNAEKVERFCEIYRENRNRPTGADF
jgi:hypothetical protein